MLDTLAVSSRKQVVRFQEATSSSTSTSSTKLIEFPQDATFRIWRKPNDRNNIKPVDGGSMHVSELITGDGNFLLICFESMITGAWNSARTLLQNSKKLGQPLLTAAIDQNHIASALFGIGTSAGLHGLTKDPTRQTLFAPSDTLMGILDIQNERTRKSKNAIIFIRDGEVVTKWVSGGDGDRPHDWNSFCKKIE